MKLYNTLTRTKEEFVPSEPGRVKMYVCGPTVYNYIHIGNARPMIVFDVMRRYFMYKGYDVTYVQNFTDVEDKIIAAAATEGIGAMEFAQRYIDEYFTDARALGVLDADVHPRVSEHMPQILDTIENLLAGGYAYETGSGVYFRVAAWPEYGKLSGQSTDELFAGARVDVMEEKESPLDFALWKAAKEGEISWPSPWGDGRPGWHIECSAMSRRYLGEIVDIHGGGEDLIFPHHENEIAQSRAAYGGDFVHYWLHNGYINIDNEKMSKSLGNFKLVRVLTGVYDPEALRMFILSAQYRTPVNFTDETIKANEAGLERLYTARDSVEYLVGRIAGNGGSEKEPTAKELEALEEIAGQQKAFEAELEDDFNTANALTCLFEVARLLNIYANEESTGPFLSRALEIYMAMAGVLGLLGKQRGILEEEVERLIEERSQARANRDYAHSDEIRDLLKEKGVLLEDTKDGVKWRRA